MVNVAWDVEFWKLPWGSKKKGSYKTPRISGGKIRLKLRLVLCSFSFFSLTVLRKLSEVS
jgi:hypothetical protein